MTSGNASAASSPASIAFCAFCTSFANVILQNCTFTQYDKNGYLIYNVIGQGAGWYITGGKAIPIMWAKASETGITHYYDLSGAEITLNPGKTYIGICPSDDWTSVTVS